MGAGFLVGFLIMLVVRWYRWKTAWKPSRRTAIQEGGNDSAKVFPHYNEHRTKILQSNKSIANSVPHSEGDETAENEDPVWRRADVLAGEG